MKKYKYLLILLATSFNIFAQQNGRTNSGIDTKQPQFPLGHYKELTNPATTDAKKWNSEIKGINVSWASVNERYNKELPYKLNIISQTLRGWKGEQVTAQFVISNNSDSLKLSYNVSPLVHINNKNQKIAKERVSTGFVRYVMTDELSKDKTTGCGYRTSNKFDSSLVADPIDHINQELMVYNKTSQGGWINVHIPQNAVAGLYRGKVDVKSNGKIVKTLPLEVEVINRTLPEAKDWKFHLDLWQNPYAVARYHQVKPWSKEHFSALKTEMQPYAN